MQSLADEIRCFLEKSSWLGGALRAFFSSRFFGLDGLGLQPFPCVVLYNNIVFNFFLDFTVFLQNTNRIESSVVVRFVRGNLAEC